LHQQTDDLAVTPDQIRLAQNSFHPVAALGDTAAMLFYTRLFEPDPSLRAMFPIAVLEMQARKLAAILSVAVHGLTRVDALLSALRAPGRRHVGYGIEPVHCDTVGTALLNTIAAALGDQFDADTRAAWIAAYTLIATAMQQAAAMEPEAA
jgi:hemoglobin-like flavoprotein